ncbi:penicillin-binding protein activator [Paraglaciecola sp. MB-3u-78]|uniref:penicillin-binding protein activator n=1 Tax=Paraglaciecola sp. MB-3u-78 TaxID=2058332 RepID=UPI000C32ABA2|nr:penicillin-binding protein activator [Paraglaciecola sp. MB-3u-78]PKH00285.1 penicillin-binding protein activator [Paraglaciecola sp. MB-3u-78]
MSFRSYIVFFIAILCLLSCTSSPTRQTSTAIDTSSQNITEVAKNSDYYLTQAKQNYFKNHDVYQRNDSLIQAAETLQAEQQCTKSIRMLKVLESELKDNRQRTHANLILAECYLILSDKAVDKVAAILANLTSAYGYDARIAALQAQLMVNKKQWLKAAIALQDTDIEELEKTQSTWKWIKKLDLPELEKARLSESALQPWLQLAIIIKRFALEPESFNQQLINWQSRNLGHTLVTNLPEEIKNALQQAPIQAKRIAVLLPLTGRLANQGLAIKEGILAAYLKDLPNATFTMNDSTDHDQSTGKTTQNNTQQYREIRFFDSALKTAQQLNALVADFDVVLGPLVKEQIMKLTAVLPSDKILLALNRVELKAQTPTIDQLDQIVESSLHASEHYYFSLAPEDEAQQLASHIHQKQLVRPIIFAADNPTTQRMAEAFIAKWQETPNAIRPDLTIFTDSKDMRTSVSQMLDVAQSKQRIKQMEVLSDVEVFGVERNRRDIDSIVLFANPEQAKLLNPIIEASLSPFARRSLSVFASSRSYSLDLNSNSLRDLRNLTFTDMPWMLPDHSWQDLANQTTQLWPQQQDTLLRLFAMGFDAYNLLPNLRRLKTLPQLVSHGLTGEINVDDQGVLHRRLLWAQVAQDRVKLLEMD